MVSSGRCNCFVANNYPLAFAPRLGAAYQINAKTILRAGTGIFYDRVPLLAADFTGNPTRVITQYDPRGQTTSNEVVFENEYITSLTR